MATETCKAREPMMNRVTGALDRTIDRLSNSVQRLNGKLTPYCTETCSGSPSPADSSAEEPPAIYQLLSKISQINDQIDFLQDITDRLEL